MHQIVLAWTLLGDLTTLPKLLNCSREWIPLPHFPAVTVIIFYTTLFPDDCMTQLYLFLSSFIWLSPATPKSFSLSLKSLHDVDCGHHLPHWWPSVCRRTSSPTVRHRALSNSISRLIYSVYHFEHITTPYFMTV